MRPGTFEVALREASVAEQHERAGDEEGAGDSGEDAVESDLATYKVVDQHEASAVVDVVLADDARDPSRLLRALAEDHSVVGELAFTPTDGRNTVSVRTERIANSVDLLGCTAEGQPRPQ